MTKSTDEVAFLLKKDKACREFLRHLKDEFPPGTKASFNKPGYLHYASISLFPSRKENEVMPKVEHYLKLFEKYGLVELGENQIETREKILDYV